MRSVVTRLSDRLLARLAPTMEASAGCSYVWYLCYCSGGLRYSKRCMRYCPGVPNHCSACQPVGTC
jgi:hypothetical protein